MAAKTAKHDRLFGLRSATCKSYVFDITIFKCEHV